MASNKVWTAWTRERCPTMRQTGLRNGDSGNTTVSFLFLLFDKQKKTHWNSLISPITQEPLPFFLLDNTSSPFVCLLLFASFLYSLFFNLEESQPPYAFSSVLFFNLSKPTLLSFVFSSLLKFFSRPLVVCSLLPLKKEKAFFFLGYPPAGTLGSIQGCILPKFSTLFAAQNPPKSAAQCSKGMWRVVGFSSRAWVGANLERRDQLWIQLTWHWK